MTVKANSEEHKALVNYFTKAVSSSHALSLVVSLMLLGNMHDMSEIEFLTSGF